MDERIKISYSGILKSRRLMLVIMAIGIIGLVAAGYYGAMGLDFLLKSMKNAHKLVWLCFYIYAGFFTVLLGYSVFHEKEMELILGMDERGRLYRLPCRKEIFAEAQYSEQEGLQQLCEQEKTLPSLPGGSLEIVSTISIREKDGYSVIKCWVREGRGQEQKKESYAINPTFNDYDLFLQAFRKRL